MATDNSGPHLPSSWPEAPRRDAASSWPDAPSAEVPTSWPETPRPAQTDPSWPEPPRREPSWPESSRTEPPRHDASGQTGPSWPDPPRQDVSWPDLTRPESARQDVPMSWPDATPQDGPTSWPDTSSKGAAGPTAWPDAPPQSTGGTSAWPDVSSKGAPGPSRQEYPPVPDPVPAWAQPPTPAPGAWANLSTPAPWPQGERDAGNAAERTMMYDGKPSPDQDALFQDSPGPPPPPQTHPADERTVTYAQHTENLLNDRGMPANPGHSNPGHSNPGHSNLGPANPGPAGPGQAAPGPSAPVESARIGAPPPGDQHVAGPRPGSNLSRDPSDPDRPFVTAGQISGSRTPPPERQQELWNTVFGDNYQSMGDQDALDDEPGKPIWIYALGGSVAVALVIALLYAFLWGPLASGEPSAGANLANADKATTAPKATTTKTSTTIGPLPRYSGKASPVIGRVSDVPARISMPRLGGSWQLDQRTTVKGTYGFDTRQYVQLAPERYAQVMSGPLSQRLAPYYEQDDLEPVIKQVVLSARRSFFPNDNKVRKIAQQAIKVGDQSGRLIAYSLTSGTEKATIVTMAINTGANVPAIVYISIPSEGKQLLPDIRTVMNQIKLS
ncbi:hypothetical protein [Nonomuraea sp. NPDC050643]|uniref:hypothetical protein n=1 Tax=Nonomuraea sp. NPDC050643 TaxID=3155660 RepID=UPI0033DA2D31